MAKTNAGKKIVPVKPYKRVKPGGVRKTRIVKGYRHSTPSKKA